MDDILLLIECYMVRLPSIGHCTYSQVSTHACTLGGIFSNASIERSEPGKGGSLLTLSIYAVTQEDVRLVSALRMQRGTVPSDTTL